MFLSRTLARYFAPLVCLIPLVVGGIVRAAELYPGDILVSGIDYSVRPFQDVVIRVNPTSGDVTVIASPTVGSGSPLYGNDKLALDAHGQILAANGTAAGGGIMRINPETGDRSIVSDASHGSGPTITGNVFLLNTLVDGSILAYDPTQTFSNSLFRVDATTGDRSIVPVAPFAYPTDYPTIGMPAGISVAPNGEVLMGSNFPGQSVIRLDADTGEHSIVSSTSASFSIPGVGTGPDLTFPGIVGQTFDQNGNYFYALQWGNLLRIDPPTGNRELVSSWDAASPKGSGPELWATYGLGVLPDGDLVATDSNNKLYRINPLTGDRTLIVDLNAGVLTGDGLTYGLYDFIVVPQPVPEPATLWLAGIGILAAAMMRRRFRILTCSRPQ